MKTLLEYRADQNAQQLRKVAEFYRSIGAHALANRIAALASEAEAYVNNPRKVA